MLLLDLPIELLLLLILNRLSFDELKLFRLVNKYSSRLALNTVIKAKFRIKLISKGMVDFLPKWNFVKNYCVVTHKAIDHTNHMTFRNTEILMIKNSNINLTSDLLRNTDLIYICNCKGSIDLECIKNTHIFVFVGKVHGNLVINVNGTKHSIDDLFDLLDGCASKIKIFNHPLSTFYCSMVVTKGRKHTMSTTEMDEIYCKLSLM